MFLLQCLSSFQTLVNTYIHTYLHIYTEYLLSAQQAGLPGGPVLKTNTISLKPKISTKEKTLKYYSMNFVYSVQQTPK